jgi:putative methionine-R-sulfoxide reductase with GAF domain
MSILNAFRDWLDQTATINTVTNTISQVDGSKSAATSLKATVSVGFYEGKSAEQFISERFRGQVDGVMIVDPRSVAATPLTDQDEVVISSRNFKVVHVNDEMLWNQLLVVGLKEVN